MHFASMSLLRQLPPQEKKRALLMSLSYFLVLLTYALLRPSVNSLFIDLKGAEKTPEVLLASAITLGVFIGSYDRLLKKYGAIGLFSATSFFFGFFFLAADTLHQHNIPYFSHTLYVAKEVYIVLLIHCILGHSNAHFPENVAKSLVGPLGAMGALGGVLGGLILSSLVKVWGTEIFVGISGFLILLPPLFLVLANFPPYTFQRQQGKQLPVEAIKGHEKLVFLLCALVGLGQMVVGLTNYQFDITSKLLYPAKDDLTQFQGQIFTAITALSFLAQVIIVPYLVRRISVTKIQSAFPLLFIALLGLQVGLGLQVLLIVSFVLLKAVDYSVFSSTKEIIYYRLPELPRFGAKYLADIFVYRISKGAVGLFLMGVGTDHLEFYSALSLGLWLFAALMLGVATKDVKG